MHAGQWGRKCPGVDLNAAVNVQCPTWLSCNRAEWAFSNLHNEKPDW